jgi:hypothetical protein
MLKFADTHTRLVDSARCQGIREYEAAKVERDFAQIKRAALANQAAMKAASKSWTGAWA